MFAGIRQAHLLARESQQQAVGSPKGDKKALEGQLAAGGKDIMDEKTI